MKKLIPFLLLLAACQKSHNFTKVKVGMHSKDVNALVGQPENKIPFFGVEWWIYNKDNKLIILSSDTVVNIKQDLKASQDSLKAFSNQMESLKSSMDSLAK